MYPGSDAKVNNTRVRIPPPTPPPSRLNISYRDLSTTVVVRPYSYHVPGTYSCRYSCRDACQKVPLVQNMRVPWHAMQQCMHHLYAMPSGTKFSTFVCFTRTRVYTAVVLNLVCTGTSRYSCIQPYRTQQGYRIHAVIHAVCIQLCHGRTW
jgi:hypothetical protein